MLRRRAVRCTTAVVGTAAQTPVRHIYEYKFGQVSLTQPFRRDAGARRGEHAHAVAATTATVPSTSNASICSSGSGGDSQLSAQPPLHAAATSQPHVTRLHNGVRVITHDFGGPLVSIGAYVLAGPAYDPLGCPGVGAMMHLALTTSNYNNSLFQLDRNLRSVGAAESHYELYKHYIAIRLDARADKWRAQVQSQSLLSSGDDVAAGGHTAAAMSARLKEEMSFARHPDPRVAAVQVRNRKQYVQRLQESAQQHDRDQQEQQRQLLRQSAAPHFRLNLVQDNLFTCLSAPRFHETDIERFRDTIDNEVRELRWRSPALYATQMLETVAFYHEPLGNPRMVPEDNNGNISSTVLLDQYSQYVVPANIVIAGVNVDHSALIAEYENTPYPHSSAAPHHSKASASSSGSSSRHRHGGGGAGGDGNSRQAAMDVAHEARQYTGGERVQQEERAKDMGTRPDMDTDTICALGWLTTGGRDRRALTSYATSTVVRHLLDMALTTDTSASGDNGGHNASLRYQHDEEYAGYGVRAFFTPYMTAGLLGFTVHCAPQHAVKLITDTARLLQDGMRTGDSGSCARLVDGSRLAVAKRRAVLQLINDHTDSLRDYCDFLGTALPLDSTQTKPVGLDERLDAIQRVTEADVARLREEMFSHPTSMFAHGEVLGLPSLRQMGL